MMNLADYTLPQLQQLQNRIAKEIQRRATDTKLALLKRLRKLAQDEGVTLEELFGAPEATSALKSKGPKRRGASASSNTSVPKAPLPVKYRNPNNLDQGWSGRGRKPGWFGAWLENGGSLDALENAASVKARGRRRAIAPTTLEPDDASAQNPEPSIEAPSSSPAAE
jgi:DNA-binding protein H-NS